MEHITLTTDKGFKQLKPEEGFLITSYENTDPIETYYATTEVCLPMNLDENKFKAISLEEDAKYKEQVKTFMLNKNEINR